MTARTAGFAPACLACLGCAGARYVDLRAKHAADPALGNGLERLLQVSIRSLAQGSSRPQSVSSAVIGTAVQALL